MKKLFSPHYLFVFFLLIGGVKEGLGVIPYGENFYWQGSTDADWSVIANWKADREGTIDAPDIPDQYSTTIGSGSVCVGALVHFSDLASGRTRVNLLQGDNNLGDSNTDAIQVTYLDFLSDTTSSFALNVEGTNMEISSLVNSSAVPQTIHVAQNRSLDVMPSIWNMTNMTNMTIDNAGIFRATNANGSGNIITNTATVPNQRGTSVFLGPSSLENSTIINKGGSTWLQNTTTFSNVTLRNQINNNVPGYFAVQREGDAGNTIRFTPEAPLGIDINATTNGFVLLKDGVVLDLSTPHSWVLYLEPGTVFDNDERTIVYSSGTGNSFDDGINEGTIGVPLFKDTNGRDLTGITIEVAFQGSGVNVTDGVAVPQGVSETSLDDTLTSFLLIRLNGRVSNDMTEATQQQARGVVSSTNHMVGNVTTYVQNVARRIAQRVSGVRDSGKKPSSFLNASQLNQFSFNAPSADRSFLNATEGMMGVMAEETLTRFSPLRTETSGIWAQPFAQVMEQRSENSMIGYDAKTTGIMFGIDHRMTPELVVGAAIGYAQSNSTLKLNGGKTQAKDRFGMVFANWFKDTWFVDGFLTVTSDQFRVGREVDASTVASNRHNGYQVVPSIGFGRRLEWAGFGLIPFIQGTLLRSYEQGYTETGAGLDNQTVKERIISRLRTEVGMDATYEAQYEEMKTVYGVGFSGFVSDPIKRSPINGTVGGSIFGIPDTDRTKLGGSLRLSTEMALDSAWFANLYYTGDFAERYQAHEFAFRFGTRL